MTNGLKAKKKQKLLTFQGTYEYTNKIFAKSRLNAKKKVINNRKIYILLKCLGGDASRKRKKFVKNRC